MVKGPLDDGRREFTCMKKLLLTTLICFSLVLPCFGSQRYDFNKEAQETSRKLKSEIDKIINDASLKADKLTGVEKYNQMIKQMEKQIRENRNIVNLRRD